MLDMHASWYTSRYTQEPGPEPELVNVKLSRELLDKLAVIDYTTW